MKVSEIINEASLWDLASRANQIRKQASRSSQLAQQQGQQQAASMLKPNPARQSTQSAQAAQQPVSTPSNLPPNVKVLSSHPVVLQVAKQGTFELDEFNKWHPLNRPKIDVSPGQAAILNKYLQML